MKRLILLLAVAVSACAQGPNYRDAENSDFTKANYSAVDKLMAGSTLTIDKNTPLLVATTVNIDSLNQSSRFGRLIAEQVATRLTQIGYNVVEMKLRGSVYIKEGAGEMLLSRDVKDLSKTYNAQTVVVGSYAVAAGYVYMTLKAVMATDNHVIAAQNYLLPLNENNKALLIPLM